MNVQSPFSRFPQKLRVEAENESRDYFREDDCFAVHGPVPPVLIPSVSYSFAEPVINVCRGDVSRVSMLPQKLIVTPVYRLGLQGAQGVPTGKIFIRFRSEISLEARRPDIQACGFSISESLAYARHAAWLQHADGNIAMALNEFAKLRAIPDVVLVEPQMLMRQMKRS